MTPLQLHGYNVLALSGLDQHFTGEVTLRYSFFRGQLRESEQLGCSQRLDLQRLNSTAVIEHVRIVTGAHKNS